MKFKHLALIFAIFVGSSCTQSAAPKPETNTVSATSAPSQPVSPSQSTMPPQPAKPDTAPSSTPVTGAPMQGNQPTKRIDAPRMPPLTSQAKLTREIARTEHTGTPPEDFPSDIPIYPGATIDAIANLAGSLNITLMTPDDLDQVQKYYETALKERGWKVQLMGMYGRSLQATKEGREITVNIDADALGRGSILGLVVPPNKKTDNK